jgi:formylglycine-generating enzyme required for sulfatase activity
MRYLLLGVLLGALACALGGCNAYFHTHNAEAPTVTFTALPTTVPPGGKVTLRWVTSGATNISGIWFEDSHLCGETVVTPTETTTYRLWAYSESGNLGTSAQLTVTVKEGAPVLPQVSLIASAPAVSAGQAVTLTWSSQGATAVTSSNFGATASSGTVMVNPIVSTDYTLTVENAVGQATAVVPVTVTGNTRTNATDGAALVWVPATTFSMGNVGGAVDELPVHTVSVDAFWMGQSEVSVAQYTAFCTATSRTMPTAPAWGWRDSDPMTGVTWDDAAAYAAWAGGRLPTEAEWEAAARGTDGRGYPWGDTWEGWDTAKCNDLSTGPYRPARTVLDVANYPQGVSPVGAYQMLGNVREWTADWYAADYYGTSPGANPTGPTTGTQRVTRGGGIHDYRPTATQRIPLAPTTTGDDLGFRVVVTGP